MPADPPPSITLHAPLTTAAAASSSSTARQQPPPAPAWLAGTWHVTHSTLPMWRSKRNVRITYAPLAGTSPPRIDDLVEYQALDGAAKVKTVRGVDAPVPDAAGWAWDWRGKGWLVVASSRWEVLGFGEEEGEGEGEGEEDGGSGGGDEAGKRQWAVTYFAKTLFTPAGVDLYSRHPEGLRPRTVEAIKEALARVDDEGVRELVGGLFEVKMDGARKD